MDISEKNGQVPHSMQIFDMKLIFAEGCASLS